MKHLIDVQLRNLPGLEPCHAEDSNKCGILFRRIFSESVISLTLFCVFKNDPVSTVGTKMRVRKRLGSQSAKDGHFVRSDSCGHVAMISSRGFVEWPRQWHARLVGTLCPVA